MLKIEPKIRPSLDPDFQPAVLWNRCYRAIVAKDPGARALSLALVRPDGTVFRHDMRVLAATHADANLTLRYVERLLKFLLWMKGGSGVLVAGADEVATTLAAIYHPKGERAFDFEFMGEKVFGQRFAIEAVALDALPAATETTSPQGRNLDGCRIGFD